VVKSRAIRCSRHMWEMINAYKNLDGNTEK
jgi:hypothetical protein